ncbi:MAG: hypothetical protein ACI8RZ_000481 [Myxococcota bacterium]|jgi:hypothetical protein
MLELLADVESELPALLADGGWRSLDIDYHPPRVERLYRPWRDLRLNLHRIWPCEVNDALFHPHPWPSAMKVLSGTYRMAVGYGAGTTTPPVMATILLRAGSCYEMSDPDAWHDVRPLGGPSLSIMLTGKPWARGTPVSPARPLRPLCDADVVALLADFQRIYG